MVMNEIFGEENFVEQIIWKNKYGAGAKTVGFISIHEYVLAFSKRPITNIEGSLSESEIQKHNKKDEKYELRGPYRTQPVQTNSLGDRPNLIYPILYKGQEIWPNKQWVWSKERMEEAIKNNNVEFTESNGKYSIRAKQYLKDENGSIRKGKPLSIFDGPFTQEGTQEIRELFEKDVFGFPKPSALIKAFLKLYINNDYSQDYIVLDFFAGSGTTAHAILELNKEDEGNRKFILVQMPEPCDENSEAYKAGYKTIADIAKERIRRVIQKIEKEKAEKPNLFEEGKLDLGFKVFKLASSNFKIWRSSEIDSAEKLVEQLDAFTDPIRPGAEKQNMLYELMLKAGYELTSPVQYVIAREAKQSQKGKKIASGSANPRNDNIGFYSINNNELIIALDAINEKLIEQIIAAKPQKVITLDSLFTGNDQLKTNTVLQMRDAGVDFKTI
jgi:adenine-specific DNA-methyltransferase